MQIARTRAEDIVVPSGFVFEGFKRPILRRFGFNSSMIVKMILSRTVDAANGAVFECAGRSMYVTKQAGGYGSQKNTPEYESVQPTIPSANCGAETLAKRRKRPASIFL